MTLLGRLAGKAIDYADLYFQSSRTEFWSLEEGIVKSGSYDLDKGVGLRTVSGEKTGFAFSDDLTLPTLKQVATAARGMALGMGSSSKKAIQGSVTSSPVLYQPDDPLTSLTDTEKVALLERVDRETRKLDPRIKEVSVSLMGSYDVVMVVRDSGLICADVRPLVRMGVLVMAEEKGRREQAHAGGGTRGTYDFFLQEDRVMNYAHEAVRQVRVSLEAVPAPAGTMVVVLGPGWPGILLHEAMGHGLEGDLNRKGTSVFSGKIGSQVASKLCTIVDDGTLANRRGSLNVDDEGTPSQCSVLIENGILRGYMQDVTNARLMKQEPTGNGRRQSYAYSPMPRMTNTYMLPGKSTHEEIIKSVDTGLYATNFSGGEVDITSGQFVFSANEAYLIEKGRVTQPVKGATLIGHGPDVLTKITMVGNNLELDSGVGTCGKYGQSVPVGVGQPTLRVDGLTVGGVAV